MSFIRDSQNLDISIVSTRFLMSVAILKRGKVEIFENDGLIYLLALLDKHEDEQLILNILQTLGNVAEEPRGRKYMLEHLSYVDKYIGHENDLIREQAVLTKDIITWLPYETIRNKK